MPDETKELSDYTADGLPIITLETIRAHGQYMMQTRGDRERTNQHIENMLRIIDRENPGYSGFIVNTAKLCPKHYRRWVCRDLASAYMLFKRQAARNKQKA